MNKLYFYPLLLALIFVCFSGCSGGDDTQAVPDGNTAPTADTGVDKNIVTGVVAILDGSASSDPDGDVITYQWSFESIPLTSTATLFSVTTDSPSFTPDIDGIYTISLVVNDGTVDSTADTVTLTASATANNAPVADAGPDQNVVTWDTVILDGSASSDPDDDPLTYQWSFDSIPQTSTTATLLSVTTASPLFTPDVDGVYTISLVVNDGTVDSPADTVTFTASATANNAPVADAGDDQNVSSGATVLLDGSGSSDLDAGDTLTYQWVLQSQPGSSLTLSSPTAVDPSFVAVVDGFYTISLVVNDGTVDSASDTVVVTAGAAFAAGQTKYDAACASCHKAGSYDTGGSASDIYNKGEVLIAKPLSTIKGMTKLDDLTAQEIDDLNAFLENPSIAP